MHILGASRSLPFHSIGGMQAIAWDLFRQFVKQGHRVTVLTTTIPGRPASFEEDGVQVVQVAGSRPEAYGAAWWAGSDAAAIALHQQQPVDAVLSISVAAAGLKQLRAAAPRAKFILQAHGTSWGELESKLRSGRPIQWLKASKNFLWLFKDARIYRWFDHIVLVGDTLVNQFQRWPMPLICGATPWSLIRNGVDADTFCPNPVARATMRARLGMLPTDAVIAFAARLHPQKGGMEMLQAFGGVLARIPQSRLLMIGGGEDGPRLRAYAAQQAWRDRVTFAGAVPRPEMPAYLAAADVFAFPTLRKEGLPMNVLEALSCGLRVVTADETRDVFDAGLPIRFSDPRDQRAWADACYQALAQSTESSNLLIPSYQLSTCAVAYVGELARAKG